MCVRACVRACVCVWCSRHFSGLYNYGTVCGFVGREYTTLGAATLFLTVYVSSRSTPDASQKCMECSKFGQPVSDLRWHRANQHGPPRSSNSKQNKHFVSITIENEKHEVCKRKLFAHFYTGTHTHRHTHTHPPPAPPPPPHTLTLTHTHVSLGLVFPLTL